MRLVGSQKLQEWHPYLTFMIRGSESVKFRHTLAADAKIADGVLVTLRFVPTFRVLTLQLRNSGLGLHFSRSS